MALLSFVVAHKDVSVSGSWQYYKSPHEVGHFFCLVFQVTTNTMLVRFDDCHNFFKYALSCLLHVTQLRCNQLCEGIFMFLTVIFGQFLKSTCFISAIHIDFLGMKHAAWQKSIRSDFFFIASSLLHVDLFPNFHCFLIYVWSGQFK